MDGYTVVQDNFTVAVFNPAHKDKAIVLAQTIAARDPHSTVTVHHAHITLEWESLKSVYSSQE